MGLRRQAHDWSLVFCGAIATYLLAVILAARMAAWISTTMQGRARLVLGLAALELAKAPGLLVIAWALGLVTQLPGWQLAAGLVSLTYGLELLVATLLDQTAWTWGLPFVLISRLLVAALLGWLCARLAERARRPSR